MVNIVFPVALAVLSFMTDGGCQMQLEPESVTVMRGSEVRLTCSTSAPWTVMVWLLNDAVVLSISSVHGMLPSADPNVTAEDHSAAAAARSSWVLVLRAAERHHQGHVTCDLQNVRRKSALFVQEKGSVEVSGGNRIAFRGQLVRFKCTAAEWFPDPRVEWRVNGAEVSRGEYNVSRTGGPFTVTSDLCLRAATSSQVECLASVTALAQPLSSTVRLSVVTEVLQEQECTVLLTSTAVLSSLLLFLLLSGCIVCIVLCCRRRRRTMSGQSSVAEAAAGKVNLGYSAEGLPDDFTKGTRGQTDSVSVLKVPDVVSSRSRSPRDAGQAQVDLSKVGSQNVRRLTTV
ncbi:unnamed protein product [Merluccius merluccius]